MSYNSVKQVKTGQKETFSQSKQTRKQKNNPKQ